MFVSESKITVLKISDAIIPKEMLTVCRHQHFQIYGSVGDERFGHSQKQDRACWCSSDIGLLFVDS